MKKRIVTFIFCYVSVALAVADIQRVEPAFWWVDMKNPVLQVMVYGTDVAASKVSLEYPGVQLDEVVQVDNPNYLFLYLKVAPEAQPGTFDILFRDGKKTKTYTYELKPRATSPGAAGFTPADVMYLITPDRFANGDPSNDNVYNDLVIDRNNPNSRHGGDLKGVMDRLDYIADLGFTTIWLNPVQENKQRGGSYHGYAITDFYQVDARFGTNREYCDLIEQAHRKGLKVVMDMIFNHCGSDHWWMGDLPAKDWLNHQEAFEQTTHYLWPVMDVHAPQTEIDAAVNGWFTRGMPDLNQRNRHLATYLIQNSIWWIEYSRIDGIRQDTHPYADFDFMARWCKEVLEEYPEFNIVGEAWYSKVPATAWWQRNSKVSDKESYLKTIMDFGLTFACEEVFAIRDEEAKALNPGHFYGFGTLYELLAQDFLHADLDNILIFLDNHDLSRFVKKDETDLWRYKQALAFLLTTRGIPQLYYGMEILMSGEKREGDGNLRKDFPGGWPGDPVDAFTKEDRTPLQNEAWDYMQTLLQWRKNNQAVTQGKLIHYTPDQTGCYVYARIKEGATVLVILNGHDKEETIDMYRFREVLQNSRTGREVITGEHMDLNGSLNIPAKGTYIMELQ
ncbi:MAG: glycoside hydrolase family 13 protein [Tannerellaceae bacterium]|nr:glycoside hydrolase family 13 protein [Tannerellaceae bacterium]